MEEVYTIADYLPIEDVEITDYVRPLFDSAKVTYEKDQYQFSYFAIHLIFMTYIYSTVWKIRQFHKDKYEHSLLFARPYKDCKVDFKEIRSIFEFSHLPEKDIFEFFKLIGLDNEYIQSTKKLIDYRNQMAHATGKIEIVTDQDFNVAIKEILSVIKKIHEKLCLTIKNWYREELLSYSKTGLMEGFSTISDYIDSKFIAEYSLSQNELLVCSSFGLSKLKNRDETGHTREEVEKIIEFHEAVKNKYKEITGIEELEEELVEGE